MNDRPLRADARRKREQILAAASDEVAELADRLRSGGSTRLSLEAVAARAGVGVGTLYRHFPTREALVEAVYQEELDQVCAAASAMLACGDPVTTLRAWMGRYLDFVDSKRAMGEEFRGLVASGVITRAQTRARLGRAVETLLQTGAFRADVTADDVVAAMAGAAFAAAGEQPRAQAERLLDILVDGLVDRR